MAWDSVATGLGVWEETVLIYERNIQASELMCELCRTANLIEVIYYLTHNKKMTSMVEHSRLIAQKVNFNNIVGGCKNDGRGGGCRIRAKY